jgi:uncharacterized protein (TIRG00374 family)
MPGQESENYGEKPLGRFRKRLAISIIAGLVIFIGLAIYADVGKVTQTFAEFRWVYIPLILALTLLNYLLRFYKWDYYLRNISVKLKGTDSLAIFLSGLTMSVTPAKLGEVFKSYLLKRLNGTEISRSVPVVFAERITDVLGLLILAAISFSAFQYGKEVLIVVLASLLALVIVIKSRRISTRLLEITESVPLLNKLSDSLRIAYESAYTLFGFKNLIVATVISVISWGFECLAMYFVLQGFGVDASVLLSTFVFSFSSLAGAVSMIPGGLVVAEGSFAGLLIITGISKGVAASATMIIRFCTLWFGVVVGFIAFFLTGKRIGGGRRHEGEVYQERAIP